MQPYQLSFIVLPDTDLSPLQYYINAFLEAKASRSKKTQDFYRLPLSQFVNHSGAWPPTDAAINSYLANCRSRGLKPNTLFAYYRAIKTWLKWLVDRGVLQSNPIDLVEKPRRSKRIPRAPKKDNLRAFFAEIRANQKWAGVRDLCLFYLLLDTGMRVGEVASLEIDDVDIRSGQILIRETKTDEQRIVVYSRRIEGYLLGWLAVRAGLGFSPNLQALFVSYSNRRGGWFAFSTDGIRQAKDRYVRRAGIAHLRVHDLRHAYAIYKLRNNADLEDIQAGLGHRNISTTAIYLKAEGRDRRKRHNETTPTLDI